MADLTKLLREQITSGAYVAGDKLPSEAKLCATHAISRTVVREAIAALRADGLVASRQGSGVYVLDARIALSSAFRGMAFDKVASVIQMLELRLALETEAAVLAATRRSGTQEVALVRALDTFLAAHRSGGPTAQQDRELHLTIADATNNPKFGDLLRMFGRQMIPRLAVHQAGAEFTIEDRRGDVIAQDHTAIVAAILNRDPEGARRRMYVHLSNSLDHFRRSSAPEAPPRP